MSSLLCVVVCCIVGERGGEKRNKIVTRLPGRAIFSILEEARKVRGLTDQTLPVTEVEEEESEDGDERKEMRGSRQ